MIRREIARPHPLIVAADENSKTPLAQENHARFCR